MRRIWIFVLLAVSAGAQTQPASPEPPFWKKIDWSDRSNQIALALGIGALILTKVIFRKLDE